MKLLLFSIFAAVIFSVISVINDEKNVSKLKKILTSSGYCISDRVDVPNIKNDNKPFCFLVDKTNKKWFLADYKASYAKACDFSDIVDYKITYRLKGTSITSGEEHCASGLDALGSGVRIFDEANLNKDNCEYIAFELAYRGDALNLSVCSSFVLYEEQRGFIYVKNHDFAMAASCIENAKTFEALLSEIIEENKSLSQVK